MSGDRELLELAAKAAGVELMEGSVYSRTYGLYKNHGGWWNPLEDDADALRLAVKLALTICNEHESAGVTYCTRADLEDFPVIFSGEMGDPHGITDGDYAATRRAIVLSAAQIGSAMP